MKIIRPDGTSFWTCEHCMRPIPELVDVFCSPECRDWERRIMGNRLAVARLMLGMTPAEIAGKLGMTAKSYRAWEQGRRFSYVHVLIDRFWGQASLPLNPNWLLCGERPPLLSDAEFEAWRARQEAERLSPTSEMNS